MNIAVFRPEAATATEKRAAQLLLQSTGYYVGAIDAQWGPLSQKALARYRAAEYPAISIVASHAAADADGAPRCYHPNEGGLDCLSDAKDAHGHWCGIAVDIHGKPYVQGADDPAPGYYVSTTSLQDARYAYRDPRRYVDAEKYAGSVLPESLIKAHNIKLGDLVLVERLKTGGKCWSVFHDVGPAVGEASLFVIRALGGNPNPKHGGIPDACRFTIYPGSGLGRALDQDELAARVRALGLV